jgi:hypothetical protein
LGQHIKVYHKEVIVPQKPAIDPPRSPIPPLEVRTVEKVVEKTVLVCPCGAKLANDIERSTHLVKCNWLASYVAKYAGGIKA